MRKRLFRLALAELIISVVLFIINFFFFHVVTDTGITTVFQEEAGKPFVALLIGIFATLNLFGATISLLCGLILADKS